LHVVVDGTSKASVANTIGDDDLEASPFESVSSGSGAQSPRHIEAGRRVGRYVVLDRLGAGAMGIVYAAYDPELDRRVALKLLQPRRVDALESSAQRARLLREAQALARLSHPNVVAVHDVGTFERRVYVAMEFVEGETLREWSQHARTWREVLTVFIQAGRGLAAAHAAGLVHRDFKPENVVIASDGGVKVLDFGLARATEVSGSGVSEVGSIVSDIAVSPGLSLELTRTGGVLGTPAYMSPEQHSGLETTPRSDQFCFCVALYEALYGERPYSGDTVANLAYSITAGEIRSPVEGADVPPWLRRVVLRGLQTDPQQRFVDMPALLLALATNPAARMRRIVTVIGAVTVAAALGFFAVRGSMKAPPCSGAEARVAEVWDGARGEQLERAFARSELPYARHIAGTVRRELDAWAGAWAAGHREACEATRVRNIQSEDLLDRRMHCLERARAEVSAIISRLVDADAVVIERAADAVAGLPDVRVCEDASRLLAGPAPLVGEAASRADAIAAILDEVGAAVDLDDHRSALLRGLALQPAVAMLDDPATSFRFASLLAALQDGVGGAELQVEHWREAYHAADRGGDDWGRVRAAAQLASVYGNDLAQLDVASAWLEHGEAALRRIDEPASLRARLDLARAAVAIKGGDYEVAIRILRPAIDLLDEASADLGARDLAIGRLALALAERGELDEATALQRRYYDSIVARFGPDHPNTAMALGSLASTAYARGDYAQAIDLWERDLSISERVYGRQSTRVMDGLNNHAVALLALGRADEAEREHREILAFLENRHGSEDIRLTPSLENLGNVLIAQADFAEAREVLSRSLAIKRRVYGDEHPSTAMSEMNLGVAMHQLGHQEDAERLHLHALAVWTEKLGPEHPDLGLVHTNLGDVVAARQRHAEAAEHQERAIALLEPLLGADSAELGFPLTGLGLARLELGDLEGARAAIERATTLREGLDLPPGERARMSFVSARILVDDDPDLARELAQSALEEARTSSPRLAAQIELWLDSGS
jgi:eukaryotic-like serine/threonine-protein kinase